MWGKTGSSPKLCNKKTKRGRRWAHTCPHILRYDGTDFKLKECFGWAWDVPVKGMGWQTSLEYIGNEKLKDGSWNHHKSGFWKQAFHFLLNRFATFFGIISGSYFSVSNFKPTIKCPSLGKELLLQLSIWPQVCGLHHPLPLTPFWGKTTHSATFHGVFPGSSSNLQYLHMFFEDSACSKCPFIECKTESSTESERCWICWGKNTSTTKQPPQASCIKLLSKEVGKQSSELRMTFIQVTLHHIKIHLERWC